AEGEECGIFDAEEPLRPAKKSKKKKKAKGMNSKESSPTSSPDDLRMTKYATAATNGQYKGSRNEIHKPGAATNSKKKNTRPPKPDKRLFQEPLPLVIKRAGRVRDPSFWHSVLVELEQNLFRRSRRDVVVALAGLSQHYPRNDSMSSDSCGGDNESSVQPDPYLAVARPETGAEKSEGVGEAQDRSLGASSTSGAGAFGSTQQRTSMLSDGGIGIGTTSRRRSEPDPFSENSRLTRILTKWLTPTRLAAFPMQDVAQFAKPFLTRGSGFDDISSSREVAASRRSVGATPHTTSTIAELCVQEMVRKLSQEESAHEKEQTPTADNVAHALHFLLWHWDRFPRQILQKTAAAHLHQTGREVGVAMPAHQEENNAPITRLARAAFTALDNTLDAWNAAAVRRLALLSSGGTSREKEHKDARYLQGDHDSGVQARGSWSYNTLQPLAQTCYALAKIRDGSSRLSVEGLDENRHQQLDVYCEKMSSALLHFFRIWEIKDSRGAAAEEEEGDSDCTSSTMVRRDGGPEEGSLENLHVTAVDLSQICYFIGRSNSAARTSSTLKAGNKTSRGDKFQPATELSPEQIEQNLNRHEEILMHVAAIVVKNDSCLPGRADHDAEDSVTTPPSPLDLCAAHIRVISKTFFECSLFSQPFLLALLAQLQRTPEWKGLCRLLREQHQMESMKSANKTATASNRSTSTTFASEVEAGDEEPTVFNQGADKNSIDGDPLGA
ncbi:unnamed protein product, partial [Amoebophrya sp. A120]